jgi:hypothetical protein
VSYRFILTVVLCMMMPSCDSQPPAQSPPAQQTRPGLLFEPAYLRVGDRIGDLVVDSVEAQRTPADSSYVGVARFRGELALTGTTLPHFDADARNTTTCFEADSSSAARMPRWRDDTRRSWFCFENRSEALAAFGPLSDSVPVTVVIDRFTINRGLSDQVNSARFVRGTRGISR